MNMNYHTVNNNMNITMNNVHNVNSLRNETI